MVQSHSWSLETNIGMKEGEVYVIHKTLGLKRLELIHIWLSDRLDTSSPYPTF